MELLLKTIHLYSEKNRLNYNIIYCDNLPADKRVLNIFDLYIMFIVLWL